MTCCKTAFRPRHETSIHPVTSLAQRKHKEQVFKMLNYSRSWRLESRCFVQDEQLCLPVLYQWSDEALDNTSHAWISALLASRTCPPENLNLWLLCPQRGWPTGYTTQDHFHTPQVEAMTSNVQHWGIFVCLNLKRLQQWKKKQTLLVSGVMFPRHFVIFDPTLSQKENVGHTVQITGRYWMSLQSHSLIDLNKIWENVVRIWTKTCGDAM